MGTADASDGGAKQFRTSSLADVMATLRASGRADRETGHDAAAFSIDMLAVNRRLYRLFRDEVVDAAANDLARQRPDDSARQVLTRRQRCLAIAVFASTTIFAAGFPASALAALNIAALVFYAAALFFRLLLMATPQPPRAGAEYDSRTPDDDLPVVTILAPLFRDAGSLPVLAQAIGALDYPPDKLDVKLLLEETDPETRAAAAALRLDERFEIVVIPRVDPQTKPKACNVGLQLARGEYVVIYDAEDIPEPAQLRKAARAFAGAGEDLACLQARLNFYNGDENWLTRMFALEYAMWFGWLLPGLERLGAPIPLGGTSNIFRTRTLIDAGGWDPYNVTEDADLGLRLSRLGYRVAVLDSLTLEEANCRVGNWLRQRSRWLKGYLMTWLVHMRRPGRILRANGVAGFVAIQLFVAGNVACAFLNPILLASMVAAVISGATAKTQPLAAVNMTALVAGNLFFMLALAMAPLRHAGGIRMRDVLYGLTAPAYWLLSSAAVYKALWDAVWRPHHWEKTEHALSPAAQSRTRAALAAFGIGAKETQDPCPRSQDGPM